MLAGYFLLSKGNDVFFKADEWGHGDCTNKTLGQSQAFMFSQLTCPFPSTFVPAVCPGQCVRSVPKNPWLFLVQGEPSLLSWGHKAPLPSLWVSLQVLLLPLGTSEGPTWSRLTFPEQKCFRFVCTNACANTGIIHGWEPPNVLLPLLYHLEALWTWCLTNPL